MVWLKPLSRRLAPLEMGTAALAPMQLTAPQMTVPAWRFKATLPPVAVPWSVSEPAPRL